MESDGGIVLLSILIGGAVVVLLGPPLLLALYRGARHRRGRWLRRSVHRSRH